MPDPKPRRDRLFWILIITSVTVFTSGAILGAGWQMVAAYAPEPRWMVRVTAGGMLAGVILLAAAGVLLWRRRNPGA